ncbi:MAG: succinate dehydrogenase/fumarate reductase iron-sulfur subunit [Cystobacterineae bacterium]|nr:succinate dehydrogenase/fumarate reductase iron-sulfur subunit [Cystobacterineae bacterium]
MSAHNEKPMKLKLHVWRQRSPQQPGEMKEYALDNVDAHMSFLEMMDVLNEQLANNGEEPVAFDHDCREGICGMCSMVINGQPHGGHKGVTTCQLHMRHFSDGDDIYVEPWRAKAFPVLRDLVVDRSSLDRIIQAGGYVSVNTGGTPDANALPIPKTEADQAMDAAACIGCGACVAACKNSSAMLFMSAKVSHLGHLPQGQAERYSRVKAMVQQMDAEGFGNCSNLSQCEAACPKEISSKVIAELNRDFLKGSWRGE